MSEVNTKPPTELHPIPPLTSTPRQRSDEIRRRRADKVRQPRGSSASLINRALKYNKTRSGVATRNNPPVPPPVMARSSAFRVKAEKYSKKSAQSSKRIHHPRRVYNVALGSHTGSHTGVAEMRIPAIPRIQIGWRLASFFIAGLLIYGLYTLWQAPLYRVKEDRVMIYGLQRLSEASVRTVLDIQDKPVFLLDAQAMQESLLDAFPEFSSAMVTVQLPHTVVLTVTERVPVLLWQEDGHTNLIDADGMLFPLRDENVQTNYPLVEASSTPPAPPVLTEEIPATERVLSTVGRDSGSIDRPVIRPFLYPEMVSAILLLAEKAPEGAVLTYDSLHGLGWKDRRGWVVYFGNVLETKHGDISTKLLVYKGILETLKAQDSQPAIISVEYVHAPYYRLTDESGD